MQILRSIYEVTGFILLIAAGVAVELVHMASLIHDDVIDRAHFRRGKAAAWSAHGPDAARATGDYLFARAFAELAATGDAEAVSVLADATLCLSRGEALQRTQTNDPSTTVEAYIERCGLKSGASCCTIGIRSESPMCRRLRMSTTTTLPASSASFVGLLTLARLLATWPPSRLTRWGRAPSISRRAYQSQCG